MPGIDETKQFVPLKFAVLTISDSRSLKDDKSGALLVQRIVNAGHFVSERSLVLDEVEAIRARVKAWIADPMIDVIITTGGTGFTGRDVTPEAAIRWTRSAPDLSSLRLRLSEIVSTANLSGTNSLVSSSPGIATPN